MTPERLDQIRKLFAAAFELAPSERKVFLARSCGSDLVLLAEVESLLEESNSTSSPIHGSRIMSERPTTAWTKTHPSGPGPYDPSIPDGRLKGRYRLQSQLGRGGFGLVCLATDEELLSKRVVIKIMLNAAPDAWARRKFRGEIEALARLNHPGIVSISDSGETADGRPFLVMEYVEGESLRSLVRTEGMELAMAADIIRQVGSALDTAHRNGIWHRDLKPENVIVQTLADGEQRTKLIDFGIATVQSSEVLLDSTTSRIAGTIRYMAPEQLEGKPSASSDIYALGVIAYEMVTGRMPFRAETAVQLHEMQMAGVQATPMNLRPNLTEEADRAILKALQFDESERYSNVTDFIQGLVPALYLAAGPPAVGGESGRVTSIGSERPSPFKRRGQRRSASPTRSTSPERRNRIQMIRRVRHDWIDGVLNKSLGSAAPILLKMAIERIPIQNPSPSLLNVRSLEHLDILPAGTRITTVFDEHVGQLLILGQPGSGKSTLLLQLAAELLMRAEEDDGEPMPAIFNLSAWATDRLPLADWLVVELNRRYDVPLKLAEFWVSTDQITPLLDGLDEVGTPHRAYCADAINKFRENHGMLPMCVCSRAAHYRDLKISIRLPATVIVQPLTRSDIEAYLEGTGRLCPVKSALDLDDSLWELFETPLILSIAIFTFLKDQGLIVDGTLEDRRRRLFDVYVSSMLGARKDVPYYVNANTIRWLAWLATAMSVNRQTTFAMEDLRPELVPASGHRLVRILTRISSGLICATLTSVPFAFVVSLSSQLSTMTLSRAGLQEVWQFPRTELLFLAGLVLGAVLGVLGGFGYRGRFMVDKRPVSALNISWTRLSMAGLRSIAAYFRERLKMDEMGAWYEMELDQAIGTIEIPTHSSPYEAVNRSLRSAVLVWLCAASWTLPFQVIGATFWLSMMKMGGGGVLFKAMLGVFLAQSATIPVYMGLRRGGLFCIQHFVVRITLWRQHLTPWRVTQFLDYCVDQSLLRRVGGAYIFVHELLAKYFGSLYQGSRIESLNAGENKHDPSQNLRAQMSTVHELILNAERAAGEHPMIIWGTWKEAVLLTGAIAALPFMASGTGGGASAISVTRWVLPLYWLSYILRCKWHSGMPTWARIYGSVMAAIALYFISALVLDLAAPIVLRERVLADRKGGQEQSNQIVPPSGSGLSSWIQSVPLSQAKDYGLKAYEEHKYETARQLFERAVQANPKDAGAWNDLVRALAALGRAEEAREAYEKRIAVNPMDQYAYDNLAVLYELEGRWNKAVESLKEQLHIHPSDRFALANLPGALIHEARWVEAEQAASRAAQAQPGNPQYPITIALSKVCIGNVRDARKELTTALGNKPSDILLNKVAFCLAECDRNLGLAEFYITQALRMKAAQSSAMDGPMDTALSFQTSLSMYLDTYGWVLFKMRKLDQAAEVLYASASLAPRAEVFAHLAEVEWKIGRTEDASHYWREATFLEPTRVAQVPTELVSRLKQIATQSTDRVWYPMQTADSESVVYSKHTFQAWYFFVITDTAGSVQSVRALDEVDPLAIALLHEVHNLTFPIVRINKEAVRTVQLVRLVKERSGRAFAYRSFAPAAIDLAMELERIPLKPNGAYGGKPIIIP
jgi:serine/threonine protein kinase/tetratricopeptide (TPR) repeat protein